MSKKVLIPLAPGFEEIEAMTPADLLKRSGAEVILAGVGALSITGAHGITIQCDCEISDADEVYDCICCPGGMPGASNLAASWEVMRRLALTAAEGKLLAAICASPAIVLYPAGLLDGYHAVCFPGMEDYCPGYTFGTERVATDRGRITARSAGCAVEFALELIESLFGSAQKQRVSDAILAGERQ